MKKVLLSFAALVFNFTMTLPLIIDKMESPNGSISYWSDNGLYASNLSSGEYYATLRGIQNEMMSYDSEQAFSLFNYLQLEYEKQEAAKAWSQNLGEGFSVTPK